MAPTASPTPESILRDAKAGKIAPVYYLMGEEPYYIDYLSQKLVRLLIKPEEEDFNLDLLYGGEVNIAQVIERAQTFPMMAERRVVLVREAQSLRSTDALAAYVQHPTPTTVMIFCHKHGKLDARRAAAKQLQKHGVVYESKRIYESQVQAFVSKYLRQASVEAEPQAMQMLAGNVGTDLTRIASELDKLVLALPATSRRITALMVEQLIGISKDYNAFELIGALAHKDVARVHRIITYFKGNPRQFALPQVLSNIFTFFSDLLVSFYAPKQNPQAWAEWLSSPLWKVNQEIVPARQHYPAAKVVCILEEIRRTDAWSKGVDGCKTPPGDLLQELVFVILH